MNRSLDKLVKNLNSKDFKYLSGVFRDEQLKLVKEKGVYCDEYFNSFKKFNQGKLPSVDKFFISLKNRGISEKEYQRAADVWKVLKIKNLGEYHDFYVKADVLLLCNVFERFINVSLKDYGLGPDHYFSSPGLSWHAMLKMTGIQLHKIGNINVHLFLEKGMKGGISYIATRYSSCAPNKDKTIMYWDANNLYGWAMTEYLLVSDFKFLSEKEIKDFDLNSIKISSIGYILEVDLEYCKELHDLHSDYPLCPEKIEVSYDMLSDYCKEISDWYDIKVGGVKKLIPNLSDKVKYVVHYKNL